MTHQKWTVLFLLFVSFSAVFVSVTGTAHAQSSQSIVPTITLASHPCNPTVPDPDCLVGVTTSVKFKIHFSSSIDADTFTGEDIISSDIDGGTMTKDFGQFIYYAYVSTDRTVTIQIPADAVSDTLGNTNSAAQLTVRIDHHNPTIIVPEEYLDAYDGYTQAVQIKQPYEEPNITCVDKVYERVSEDDIFIRNDYYDAVPKINVTTNFEPEDLPKRFNVRYTCLDDGHRVDKVDLDVILVEDLSVFNTPPALLKIERYSSSTQTTDSQTLTYTVYFSSNVVGVDKNDFVLSPGSTGIGSNATHPVTNVSPVSSGIYYVTISVATDGTYNLDLVSSGHGITDIARKPLTSTVPTGADQTYTVGTTVTDTANPRLASIERYSPASRNTDSQSLVYKATFSESVTGVTASDFTLSPGSTGGGNNGNSPVTDISGSGDTYYVTVSSTVDGTYNLDLVSSGHSIADDAGNPLTNTAPATGPDQTYNVSITTTDTTNPTLELIERYSPSSATTSSQTLVYRVTFSEDVIGVGADDFALSPGSSGEVGTSSSTTTTGSETFTKTRSPALAIPDLTTVSDSITIPDSGAATSVSVTVNISHTYIGDLKVVLIAPDGTTKTMHNRSGGSDDDINQTYTPDFDDVLIAGTWKLQIRDNANSDFGTLNSWTLTINYGGTTTTTTITTTDPVSSISGFGSVYYATITEAQGGTYNLDLVSSGHNIADDAGNSMTNTAPTTGTDQTYTVSTVITDTANPRLASIERYSPASQNTDSQTLVYKATFSESVTGVTASDFVLSPGSTGGVNDVSPVTAISGSGDTYYVTVSSTVDGTYNLDLVSSGHSIADTAGNSMINTAPTGADQTYTVSITVTDTTNPRLASIERYSPASQNTDSQTLVYKATFSESVTGVTASDFVLSPDSTGWGSTTVTTTGQFTQTRSPNLTLPNLQTVSDTITVSDSETATSVTVAVNITHAYISDLKVDLVAPDGTTNTLHNRSGGGDDDIFKTYYPSFGSIPISGVWTLRINDNYDADSGVLNSWTLTINYDTITTTTTTVNPVTDISGSGDTYYVTVSSTVDGTYNLDLVSSGHNIADDASNPLTNTATTGADQTYTVSTT